MTTKQRALYPRDGSLEPLLVGGLGINEESIRHELMEPRLRAKTAVAFSEGRVTGPHRCPVCGMRNWKFDAAQACCEALTPGVPNKLKTERRSGAYERGRARNAISRWEKIDAFDAIPVDDSQDYEL